MFLSANVRRGRIAMRTRRHAPARAGTTGASSTSELFRTCVGKTVVAVRSGDVASICCRRRAGADAVKRVDGVDAEVGALGEVLEQLAVRVLADAPLQVARPRRGTRAR